MKENLALIGMMGTSKTTAGRMVSQRLGLDFLDTDEIFERHAGMTVAEYFAVYGEGMFRDGEQLAVREAAAARGAVIACGGGVPLRPGNMDALTANAVVVLMTARPEVIFERTRRDDTRPLIRGGIENIRNLLAARKSFYERRADLTVDNSDLTPSETADKIIDLLHRSGWKSPTEP